MNSNSESNKIQVLQQELICPITGQLMQNPVTIQSGHTFQKQAIQNWFKRGNMKNPVTGLKLKTKAYYPNISIKSIIGKLPNIQNIIKNTIKKQSKQLQRILNQLEQLWDDTDITDTSIRRHKVKLEFQNKELKTQVQLIRLSESQLRNRCELLTKQCQTTRGQLIFNLNKLDNVNRDKRQQQLKFKQQLGALQKQGEKQKKQIKVLRAQLIQKDKLINTYKQNQQKLKLQVERYKRSNSAQRKISLGGSSNNIKTQNHNGLNSPINRQTDSNNGSREKQNNVLRTASTQRIQKMYNSQQIYPSNSNTNIRNLRTQNNYQQTNFVIPSYRASSKGRVTVTLQNSSKQKYQQPKQRFIPNIPITREPPMSPIRGVADLNNYQPSKWTKSPKNNSLQKKPSIRELLYNNFNKPPS